MSLTTEWQARLSTQRQVELTNPDDRTATTAAAARLAAAVADATAEFLRITGRVLDTTDHDHVRVGCLGVTAYLLSYGPVAQSDYVAAQFETWRRSCAALVDLAPATTSLLTPTDPDLSGGPVAPDFDRANFDDLNLRPGSGGGRTPAPGFFG